MARQQRRNEDKSLIGELFQLSWERPGIGTIVSLLLLLAAGILHGLRLPITVLGSNIAPLAMWVFLGLSGLIFVATVPGWLHVTIRALLGSSPPPAPPDIESAELPYQRAAILTDGEKAFYDVLVSAVPNDQITILLKVRLADLLHVPADEPRYKSWFGRVAQKHVDFVLCDKFSVIPFLAIELDDRSHDRPDRATSDRLKDIVLPHIGIPLERVRCQPAYDVVELENLVAKHAPITNH